MNDLYAGILYGMTKTAYGKEGHTGLMQSVSDGLGVSNRGRNILTEYGADIADGRKGSGVLYEKSQSLAAKPGKMNRLGSNILGGVSSLGTNVLDGVSRNPLSPIAQKRHAFPGTKEGIRDVMKAGRTNAADLLARAAIEKAPKAQQRLYTQALGHIGETSHTLQDIIPHQERALLAHQQALAGAIDGKANTVARMAEKAPASLKPMAISGSGHIAMPTIDSGHLINNKEFRTSKSFGKGIKNKALQVLKNTHGIGEREAATLLEGLMSSSPSAAQEMAGKGLHRAKGLGDIAKGIFKAIVRR